jgi:hypothetical protein
MPSCDPPYQDSWSLNLSINWHPQKLFTVHFNSVHFAVEAESEMLTKLCAF